MPKEKRIVVRVSAESDATIRAYAERKGLSVSDAADACIAYASRRIAALTKYEAKRKAARS